MQFVVEFFLIIFSKNVQDLPLGGAKWIVELVVHIYWRCGVWEFVGEFKIARQIRRK